MQKTLFSQGNRIFLRLLREAREDARVTQEQLAEQLGTTQSFVSKCERGERRLDIVELRAWCKALKLSFPSFVLKFDKASDKKS